MKNLKSATLGILISLITTLIIFKFTESSLTWEVLSRVNFAFLALAILLQVAFWLIWALRLGMISRYLGFYLPFLSSIQITLSSMFIAAITPSSAGGEPLRVKMLSDRGMGVGESTFVVLTERVLDSLFFIFALPIFLIFTGFATDLGYRVAFVFLVLFLLFLYALYEILRSEENLSKFARWSGRIFRKRKISERFEKELRNLRKGALKLLSAPFYLVILFTLTALMWSAVFLIPSIILLSFGQNPHFMLSYTAQLIIIIISLIPLTPGSSGIVESSMAYLYSNFVDLGVLGSLVAVWRFITYHLNIIFGAVSLNSGVFKKFFR